MTTLTTLPQYPVPGRDCQLRFALTESGSNYLRVWIADAPDASSKKAEINKDGGKRIPFYTGASGISFNPDVGGVYKLLCQEYVKGSAYGGGYEGDPNGAPSETKVGSEVTLDLVVGQRVTQTCGYGSDTATLVWWVFGDSVQSTSLAFQGEDSPAVITPTSLRAAIAAKDPLVLAQVSLAAGALVLDTVGDLSAIVSDLVTKTNGHLVESASHNADDTDNTLPVGLGSSVGPKDVSNVLNRLLNALRNHEQNISPAGDFAGEIDGATYHQISGTNVNDRTNLPIVDSVGDLAGAYAAIGDYARCYEGHRLSESVHLVADSSNVLMAMPSLIGLHRYFFAALAALNPTAPPTVNSGVVTAVSVAGFTES